MSHTPLTVLGFPVVGSGGHLAVMVGDEARLGTGASELALMDRLCLGSRGGEPIHLSPERAVMQIVPAA